MVTKKKMTVPIFDYRLTILIYDSWDEVSYLFDSGPEPLAITRFQYGAALSMGIDSTESKVPR